MTAVLIGFSLTSDFVYAQPADVETECSRLQSQINEFGGGQSAQLPAYCNTNSIYTKITSWMYYIIGIAAVISLIYGGYLYMMARDNEAQIKKAKSVLIWTIAGIAVALLATLIVSVVVNLLVDNTLI